MDHTLDTKKKILMPPKKETKSNNPPRMGIQVIARAATVLRALESEPNGLSLGEIAQKVGLARSTVQRIVRALADEQFLISATPNARVKLGPALVRLATAANIEIDQIVRPFMQQLSRAIEETVDLSVLKAEIAIFIDQIPGSHRLQAVSAVGESFPLHCTANGKAMLASMPDDKLDQFFSGNLARFTPRTITEPEKLIEEIKNYGSTLLAFDREEHTEGICAVGTAFYDPIGRLFALSIPVPATRFKPAEKRLAKALLDYRSKIVDILGKQVN